MTHLFCPAARQLHVGPIEPDASVHGVQYRQGRFYGPTPPPDFSLGTMAGHAWDYLFQAAQKTPATPLPVQPVDLTAFAAGGPGSLNVTWLGHATLLINIDGYRLLTDPVFEKRLSPIGPSRFSGPPPLAVAALPPIDAVIISHDHYDHLSRRTILQLKRRARRFIVPLAVGARLMDWGVPAEQIVELGWWEEWRPDANLLVAATPAQHFSGRGLLDRNRTLWASFVIATPDHRLFFSGDSGYFDGFARIGRRYGPFDMTFIECGAYDQSWPEVHMFPEQSVQAHRDLGGRVLQPIHWGTFSLAFHPWFEPMERVTAAAHASGVRLATPVAGETVVFGAPRPATPWWRAGMAPARSTAGKSAGPIPALTDRQTTRIVR